MLVDVGPCQDTATIEKIKINKLIPFMKMNGSLARCFGKPQDREI